MISGPAAGRVVVGVSGIERAGAACLLVDGVLVGTTVVEPLPSDAKSDEPALGSAVTRLLETAAIEAGEIGALACFGKPWTFRGARFGPFLDRRRLGELGRRRLPVVYVDSHHAAAAAAYYPSPFERAAALTFALPRQRVTSGIAWAIGNRLEWRAEQLAPHSLATLYQTVAARCGLAETLADLDATELATLAERGEPRFLGALTEHVVRVHPDGSVTLDLHFFRARTGGRRLDELLGSLPLALGDEPSQREADLARSTLALLGDAVLKMAAHAQRSTGESAVCLGGAGPLPRFANDLLHRDGPFVDVWRRPGDDDEAAALGSALWTWHQLWDRPRFAPAVLGAAGPPGQESSAAAQPGAATVHEHGASFTRSAGGAGLPGLVASLVNGGGRPVRWLATGLARGWMARPRARASLSTWCTDLAGVEADRRAARYPLAAAPPAVRRHRLVGLVTVLLVLAVAVAWPSFADEPEPRSAPPTVPPSGTLTVPPSSFPAVEGVRFTDLPSYRGVPFANDLQAEQEFFANNLGTDDQTLTTSGSFAGRYTNVDDGVRRTLVSTCRCPSVSLWLTGGSVGFGLGQRDEHTVGSELVRLAEADGVALEVLNLSVPGWTLWQEGQAVQARLADGSTPPDLLVSVSGYNDVAGTMLAEAVRGLDEGEPTLLSSADIDAFIEQGLNADDAGGIDQLTTTAIERFSAENLRYVATVADLGASAKVFFHPDALASPAQFAPVRAVLRGLPASASSDLAALLEGTSAGLAPRVVDLRHLYDDHDGSFFVDWVHTNEEGARILAEAIYRSISAEISARASDG